jgi:hypothetical protein
MKNIFKGLGLGLITLLLVVGVGAGSASAVTLTLGAGTATSDGALTLESTGADALTIAPVTTDDASGTIVIGATDGTGAITVGSSSETQTLNLGTGAGISNVNIGTGDAANVITLGSKSVASSALSLTKVLGSLKVDGRVIGGGGTTNDYGLQIRTESAKTSGSHWGLDNESHLKGDGTTSVRGVQGVAVLDTGFTSTGGSLTGTYGQARADGTYNAPAGMVTGIYGLIEASAAMTASHVASIWADSHQANTVTGEHELIYMSNNGAATMDSAMYIYAGNKITNLLKISTASGMVSDTAATTGASKKIKIDIDGTTYYINAYDGAPD